MNLVKLVIKQHACNRKYLKYIIQMGPTFALTEKDIQHKNGQPTADRKGTCCGYILGFIVRLQCFPSPVKEFRSHFPNAISMHGCQEHSV